MSGGVAVRFRSSTGHRLPLQSLFIDPTYARILSEDALLVEVVAPIDPLSMHDETLWTLFDFNHRSSFQFECPVCQVPLQTVWKRESSAPDEDVDRSRVVYFMRCTWCMWDTRKIGITSSSANDCNALLLSARDCHQHILPQASQVEYKSTLRTHVESRPSKSQSYFVRDSTEGVDEEIEKKLAQMMRPQCGRPIDESRVIETYRNLENIDTVPSLRSRLHLNYLDSESSGTSLLSVDQCVPSRSRLFIKKQKRSRESNRMLVSPAVDGSSAKFQHHVVLARHFPRVVVLCPSDFESEVRTSLRISFVSADWRTPVDIQLNRDEVYSRGFSEILIPHEKFRIQSEDEMSDSFSVKSGEGIELVSQLGNRLSFFIDVVPSTPISKPLLIRIPCTVGIRMLEYRGHEILNLDTEIEIELF